MTRSEGLEGAPLDARSHMGSAHGRQSQGSPQFGGPASGFERKMIVEFGVDCESGMPLADVERRHDEFVNLGHFDYVQASWSLVKARVDPAAMLVTFVRVSPH